MLTFRGSMPPIPLKIFFPSALPLRKSLRGPCKDVQKDRTKTLAEFSDRILKDYAGTSYAGISTSLYYYYFNRGAHSKYFLARCSSFWDRLPWCLYKYFITTHNAFTFSGTNHQKMDELEKQVQTGKHY